MLYGAEKAREMGRSILPSTRRSAHAQQHHISRHYRRANRQAVAQMGWSEGGWLDYVGRDLLTDTKRQVRIGYLVRERRDADKIAPVMRWADAIAADRRKLDRRAYVAQLLPQNIVGWHALTHIENLNSFELDIRFANRTSYSEALRQRKCAQVESFLGLAELLLRVCRDKRLKAMNSVIYGNWQPVVYYTEDWVPVEGEPAWFTQKVRTRHVDNRAPRTLAGKNDIPAFMLAVFGSGAFRSPCLQKERDRCLSYLAQVYDYELNQPYI